MQHRIAAHESVRFFPQTVTTVTSKKLRSRIVTVTRCSPYPARTELISTARREIDGVRNGGGDDWGGE